MGIIKNSINRFDRMMSAIAFAEAGEHERALDTLYDGPEQTKNKKIESGLAKRKEIRTDLRV
jgi:hypothetical protein